MTKKTFTSRLLSIVLCLCMVLSILPATALNAFAATMTGGEVLYLKPNSNWASADARFAAYFYGSGDAWESMTEVEAGSGIYKVTVPSGSWTNVIFCRMDPSTDANNWDTRWNQSGDLTFDGTNDLCTIKDGEWNCGSNVTWSVYGGQGEEEPECTHESHSQDGKCNTCGETVEHVYVDGSCTCGAVDPTEPVSITVYCINSSKWSEVWAYAWTDGGAAMTWPGAAMTKTGDSINGYDVYEITFDFAYENVIFNNNSNGSQTDDLDLHAGQYFDVKGNTWYESLDNVPVVDLLATDRYLVGSFNAWSITANEFKLDSEGSTTGYVSLELEANTTYKFKIVREGAWTSCDTTITGDVSDLVFSSGVGPDCCITTAEAGTYVFSYNVDTSALSVTYPKSDESACTYTVNAGGTVTDYTDFSTAINAACAAESAVLTLYQNAPEGTYHFPQGNVTLDLNGMTCEGRITVYGGTLTLTDTAQEKGTVLNYLGYAVTFYEGKLILLETVDLLGLSDGHTPMCVSKGVDVGTVTVGSTGEEDIVLPGSIVAIGVNSKEETSVLPESGNGVELHRHNWIEATCTASAFCTDCATVGTEALGHSIGEDGVCTVCGIDPTKTIYINMTDSYGDGWTDNAIAVYEDNTLVGTATVEEGASATWTGIRDNTKTYSFCWMKGDYPQECAFEILFGDEVVFTATESDCEGYTDGEEVYSTCDHSYGEGVVTAPTCTKAGYTTYTCTTCGRRNAADQVAALGHSYGEDGICSVCGFDKSNTILINMTDSYADGWSDNAIAVFEDGTLVGIATVDVGESAVWTWEREADKEYTFYWMRGEYSEECSFEILFGDEVVLTATEDDCAGYAHEQMVYPVCEQHSLGEDGKCVYCGTVIPFVAVSGVKLYDGDYLDTNGTVSSTQPTGGYAWYSDGVLTLNDYTYSGKGYVVEAFEMEDETVEITALVYTVLNELSVKLEGTNTLTGMGMGYGVCVDMADTMDFEMGTLVLSGTGTLNLSSYLGIAADYITLNSGIVNIDASAGIDTPNGYSSLTVSGGELTVTASGDEYSEGIRIGYVAINGGKVIVSCDGGLALDVCTLTVNGGYLEVVKGGMEAYDDQTDEPITLGEGVSITSPEGAEFGTFYNENDLLMHTIYDADGERADAFVIEGPDVEQGGDQEPFDVVVYNQYGVADTVTLSNPVAIPGQDYVTTVSSTVGSGIGVWGIYVAEEDIWWGNSIYEFDEETNTLTVLGDYVAEGMQIEVVPYVTLTTHMNGGSAMNDYWEHVFGPDETGTFTEKWVYGQEDYFFGAWDDELGAINPDPNLVFKREGYTVVGYNTAADGSGTAYAVDALHKLAEDVEIYLIWESNTVDCPHAWIDATCTAPKTCELCGETEGEALGHSKPVYTNNGETHDINYPCCDDLDVIGEPHDYSADTHKCDCGDVQTFNVYWFYSSDLLVETYEYGATVNGFIPERDYIDDANRKGWYDFAFWKNLETDEEIQLPFTMPAQDLEITEMTEYTGWFIIPARNYYVYHYKNSEVQGWFCVNDKYELVTDGSGSWYYAGSDWNVVCDITEIDGIYYAFDHETREFLSDYTGIYEAKNGDLYYVENGIAVANKGLVKVVDEDGHIHYYYFGCGNDSCSLGDACAGEYKAQKGIHHYVKITNGYLLECGYDFGDDGVIVHIDDTSANGICEIEGIKFYLMDGIKVYKGLFELNGKYYYARSNGALVIDRTYWVSKTNDLKPAGNYTFDETGAMIPEDIKNGIYEENGSLFYYVDGSRSYAGLIEIDGNLYYVRSNGELAHGQTYWTTKTNGLKAAGRYYFDETGKLCEELKNGLIEENGGLYYYVDGKLNYAGLIEINGAYYYIRSNGQAVTNQTYWITKTNGLKEAARYAFDENGMLVDESSVKNGVYAEDGGLYYYVDGKRNYAGLIEIDGNYYYVRSNGQLVTGRTYWTTKNNDLLPAANYTFDANGIIENPFG